MMKSTVFLLLVYSVTGLNNESLLSRRKALAAFGVTGSFVASNPSVAFDNKISNKYDDRPKRRGPMPKDLGIQKRQNSSGDEFMGLKGCGPSPNCFSSTLPDADIDPDHLIPAFVWPKDKDQRAAFAELESVIKAYPPGQNGVDGGGFEIKVFDSEKGYMYVQFEALKNGYIDDVEFAAIPGYDSERSVQVRSSSRIGYLDFGVNAKRLNKIASDLRAKGWTAEGVNFDTHKGYAIENQL